MHGLRVGSALSRVIYTYVLILGAKCHFFSASTFYHYDQHYVVIEAVSVKSRLVSLIDWRAAMP
jgi:hypothetical protein